MRARRIILLLLWLALAGTPLAGTQAQARPAPVFAAAVSTTNAPAKPPLTPGNKRRAGFMAGAGLIILSLLGLGAGLALVRSFKR